MSTVTSPISDLYNLLFFSIFLFVSHQFSPIAIEAERVVKLNGYEVFAILYFSLFLSLLKFPILLIPPSSSFPCPLPPSLLSHCRIELLSSVEEWSRSHSLSLSTLSCQSGWGLVLSLPLSFFSLSLSLPNSFSLSLSACVCLRG